MGRNKALITIGGASLVERAADRLSPHCSGLLVADDGRRLLAGHRSVEDGPGRGPAAGILGAAARAPGEDLLVLACDLPLVPASLLETLVLSDAAHDWVVPGRRDRLEPLCALYRPRALEALAELVHSGQLGPHRLATRDDLDIRRIGDAELRCLGDPDTMFANLNRPADLEKAMDLVD